MVAQLTLGYKTTRSFSVLTPIESGFESLKSSIVISTPFFFLATLFVLFDLELILVFPGIIAVTKEITFILLWGFTLILILVTLVLEWAFCGLKWQV